MLVSQSERSMDRSIVLLLVILQTSSGRVKLRITLSHQVRCINNLNLMCDRMMLLCKNTNKHCQPVVDMGQVALVFRYGLFRRSLVNADDVQIRILEPSCLCLAQSGYSILGLYFRCVVFLKGNALFLQALDHPSDLSKLLLIVLQVWNLSRRPQCGPLPVCGL